MYRLPKFPGRDRNFQAMSFQNSPLFPAMSIAVPLLSQDPVTVQPHYQGTIVTPLRSLRSLQFSGLIVVLYIAVPRTHCCSIAVPGTHSGDGPIAFPLWSSVPIVVPRPHCSCQNPLWYSKPSSVHRILCGSKNLSPWQEKVGNSGMTLPGNFSVSAWKYLEGSTYSLLIVGRNFCKRCWHIFKSGFMVYSVISNELVCVGMDVRWWEF